jgi:hypothetical protein
MTGFVRESFHATIHRFRLFMLTSSEITHEIQNRKEILLKSQTC